MLEQYDVIDNDAPKVIKFKSKNKAPNWIVCYGDEEGYFKVLKINEYMDRPDKIRWETVAYKNYYDELIKY